MATKSGLAQAPAQSPLYFRANLSVANSYYWRGILRSPFPALQGDASAALLLGGGFTVAVGGWSNFEPQTARRERVSDIPPGGKGLGTWEAWGQVGVQRGGLNLAAGVQRTRFRLFGPNAHVTEIYGVLRVQDHRWAYALSAAQAVDGAAGTYLEPQLTYYHFVNPLSGPAVTLSSTLSAGIQAGDRRDPSALPVPGPVGTGLTHALFSTDLAIGINLPLQLAGFFQGGIEAAWRHDLATRIAGDTRTGSRFRVRFPLRLGVSWPYRRPE